MKLLKNLFFLSLFLFSFQAYSQGFSHFNGYNPYEQLRSKLEMISDSSQLLRQKLRYIENSSAGTSELDSMNAIIKRFDSDAFNDVSHILTYYGWLGKSQVGNIANNALFITVLNAGDNSMREKYFPMLKASAEKGESSLESMAILKDKIMVENGENQMYGTQYKIIENQKILLPVDNLKEVNKRRMELGLEKIKKKEFNP